MTPTESGEAEFGGPDVAETSDTAATEPVADGGASAAPSANAWGRASVRARTTIIATAAFGLALALASFALVSILRDSLEDRQRSQTRTAVADVADQLATGMRPTQLRFTQYELTVQVYDRAGNLISTNTLITDPALQLLHSDGTHLVPNDNVGPRMVEYESVVTPDGELTVAVANSLADLESSVDAFTGVLWVATPLLTALVGLAVWLLVGRALQPVEAMRREVDEISHSTLDRRLAIADSGDEVARLGVTMNMMLDRLEAASETQRRFVSDASHELRSPVASIRTELEVARHDPHVDWTEVSERLLGEDERLAELIDDLLTLARLDETGITRRETVDVDDLVLDEVGRSARVPIESTGINAARVSGDRRQLARMLRNLVDNAVRHASTRVLISMAVDDVDEAAGNVAGNATGDAAGDAANRDASLLALDIHDDGPGVPLSQRERIFDRFARTETARGRDRGGTGLGLAVVRSIATAHGGTVHVDDSPLGGARFAVRMPALRS